MTEGGKSVGERRDDLQQRALNPGHCDKDLSSMVLEKIVIFTPSHLDTFIALLLFIWWWSGEPRSASVVLSYRMALFIAV